MIQSCRRCSQSFEITNDDAAFYEMVSPVFGGDPSRGRSGQFGNNAELIPPPSFCPTCRYQRRLALRNERVWYNRKCDACQKDTVSIYSPDKPYIVYCQSCWWKDDWEAGTFGQEFDFSRSAFSQFLELKKRVPRMALTHWHSTNCEYTNQSDYNKDCYLLTSSSKNEKCCYGHWFQFCLNSFDCLLAEECELCYECVNVTKCYNSSYLQNSSTCSDSLFLYDCKGCKSCIGCFGLRNKEYHVFNQPVSKAQFEDVLKKLNGSHEAFSKMKTEFEKRAMNMPRLNRFGFSNENSTGDYLQNTKNAVNCFNCRHVENLKHSQDAWNDIQNSQDLTEVCWMNFCYEVNGSTTDNKLVFSTQCEICNDVYYGDLCLSCHDVFLCTGLRHKSYCILNKQYSKEEYEQLVPKIIEHMRNGIRGPESRSQGIQQGSEPPEFRILTPGFLPEWGEFFPSSLSPFGYNETVAQEYFPLWREEALELGFNWSDYVAPSPSVAKVVSASQLPDSIEQIPDEILDWAIECEVSGRPFKIIKQELAFYREHHLPLPRRHPDVRHLDRMSLRNPRKLFERDCMKCGKGMQSTYPPPEALTKEGAPEKKEIVFCEECYLREVY